MPIVSISEAARLTGKSRQTLHRHIATGKLSKCNTKNNGIGIDTSELLRVYGDIKNYNVTDVKNEQILQHVTSNVTHDVTKETQKNNKIQQLEKELAVLKVKVDEQEKRIEAKQETIDTLKSALKLLEYKQEKDDTDTKNAQSKELKQTLSSPIEAKLIDTMEPTKPSTGFWDGLRKFFK